MRGVIRDIISHLYGNDKDPADLPILLLHIYAKYKKLETLWYILKMLEKGTILMMMINLSVC